MFPSILIFPCVNVKVKVDVYTSLECKKMCEKMQGNAIKCILGTSTDKR